MTSRMPDAPLAELRGVTKRYGAVTALTDVDLQVGAGEVVGLLGPNGAGKSTAVKVLLGLVHPTVGEAFLFGLAATDPEARRRIGYLPELFRFPAWMTGRQMLRYHAELIGLDRQAADAGIPEVLERVGLADRADHKIGTYSKGMSQRIGLGQAILGYPRLVILDEPTSALDPVGRREVRELIRDLSTDGVSVLLNSHLLGEIESVCDRVAVIDHGSMIFQGAIGELTTGGIRYEIRLDETDPELLDRLGALGNVEVIDAATLSVGLSNPDRADELAAAVVESGKRLFAMVPTNSTLEDVFVTMVRGGDR